ncbi:TolC family protein, partial [Pseudomonas sp.]|uniref:TolC family protein n=1 Tax=Pseudomonas sp. TaxID=306 RepID=UPI0028A634B3
MSKRLSLSALCIALALAGCASSRGLQPQGALLDAASLRSQNTLAAERLTPASWPRADWWNSLGDARLDALIREALVSSPDLQVADARTRQASAAALAADADRQPNIDANAGINRSRQSRIDDPSGQGERYGTLRTLSVDGSY